MLLFVLIYLLSFLCHSQRTLRKFVSSCRMLLDERGAIQKALP